MAVTNPTLIQMGALGRATPMSVGSAEYLHGFLDEELGVVASIEGTSQMAGRQPKVGELPGGWYPGKYITQIATTPATVAQTATYVGLGVLALIIGYAGYKAFTK